MKLFYWEQVYDAYTEFAKFPKAALYSEYLEMKAERRRDTKKLMKARMMIHKIQSNYEVDILLPIEKVLTAVKNGLTHGQLVKSLNLRP